MKQRVPTITLKIPVDYSRNLHRNTTPERIRPAVAAFVKKAKEKGLPVESDGLTIQVSYDNHQFDYREQVKTRATS